MASILKVDDLRGNTHYDYQRGWGCDYAVTAGRS
jgi:hypothetical protein